MNQSICTYYTPSEVAEILKLSRDSIIRLFHNRPDVLSLGRCESRFKRKYKTLRIPRRALDKFIIENRVQ
jgi:hypothetical protein